MQRALWRESDRMQQEVELSPFLLDAVKNLLHLAIDGDVERQEQRGFQILGERLDVLLGLLVQIGDGEICPERAKGLCASPCDRLVVRDADHQTLAPLERDLGLGENRYVHDAFSRSWVDGRLLHSSDKVCWAIISSSSVGTT